MSWCRQRWKRKRWLLFPEPEKRTGMTVKKELAAWTTLFYRFVSIIICLIAEKAYIR